MNQSSWFEKGRRIRRGSKEEWKFKPTVNDISQACDAEFARSRHFILTGWVTFTSKCLLPRTPAVLRAGAIHTAIGQHCKPSILQFFTKVKKQNQTTIKKPKQILGNESNTVFFYYIPFLANHNCSLTVLGFFLATKLASLIIRSWSSSSGYTYSVLGTCYSHCELLVPRLSGHEFEQTLEDSES